MSRLTYLTGSVVSTLLCEFMALSAVRGWTRCKTATGLRNGLAALGSSDLPVLPSELRPAPRTPWRAAPQPILSLLRSNPTPHQLSSFQTYKDPRQRTDVRQPLGSF